MTDGATLRVRREEVDGAAILRLAGEVDLTNADELQQAIEESTAATVVLDISELGYLDSSGIRALERGYRSISDDDRRLYVVAPPDTAAGWTLKVAGFDRRLLRESVEAALAADDDRAA